MKNNAIKYIVNKIKLFPFCLSTAIASEIIATSAALIISGLIGKTLDFALYPGEVQFDDIFFNLLIIAIFTVVGTVSRFLSAFYSGLLAYKTETLLREKIFRNVNSTTLNNIDSTPHGEIVSRTINDLEMIGDGIFQFLTQVFPGITVVLGSIILLGLISTQIMFLVLLLTPLIVFISWFVTKYSYKSFREYANAQGRLISLSEEMISNQIVVNAFNFQDTAIEKFKKINEKMHKCGVKSQFLSSTANPSIRFISLIIYASVGTASVYRLLKSGSITIGGISSILIYVAQYTRPFTDIMSVITQIQEAVASTNRYLEFIHLVSESHESSGNETLPDCKGKIEIENLFFSYIPGKPVISDFNLNINPGERIALVGPTGCGKSTIINLLMRFYSPSMGNIKIDGVNIDAFDLKDLRSLFGMILQDTWLYNASVRDNIAYGKPDASLDEIISASKLANAHNFIKKLEDGYDTILYENGCSVSQGQKQLLSIARTMLIKPKILLLDEATSNIDTRTELKVQDAFNKLMQGKTSIIVAHRLSTIENADKIVVINHGKIVEIGNHSSLLENKGFYYNLHQNQFSENAVH